jgi:hypothetical protein
MSYNQPFTEHLEFFRQKLNLPTESNLPNQLATSLRVKVVTLTL